MYIMRSRMVDDDRSLLERRFFRGRAPVLCPNHLFEHVSHGTIFIEHALFPTVLPLTFLTLSCAAFFVF